MQTASLHYKGSGRSLRKEGNHYRFSEKSLVDDSTVSVWIDDWPKSAPSSFGISLPEYPTKRKFNLIVHSISLPNTKLSTTKTARSYVAQPLGFEASLES